MLDDEQKRILEELATKKKVLDAEHSQINENNQPVKMGVEENKNEPLKALRIGCGITLLIFSIIILVSSYNSHPDPGGWGEAFRSFSLCAGWIIFSIGFFSVVVPGLVQLSEFIYKKIKNKRSTPIN